MEEFLAKCNRQNSLILLMFLNIFDGIATYIGLKLGFYIELNKILSFIYKYNNQMFLIIKVIIPTMILLILISRAEEMSKPAKFLAYLTNILYIGISIYHISLYLLAIKLFII